MIGTTLKVGFDASKVDRGLGGLTGKMRGIGKTMSRATRQVGIGMARQAGVTVFGAVIKALRTIPDEIQNLSQLSKEMTALGIATKVSNKEFLALRHSIAKVTGKDADEASDFLRDVSERLGEVITEPLSTPGKALHSLGLFGSDLKGKDISEQINMIGDAYIRFEKINGTEKSMFIINELLGEVGKTMVPLFKDFNGVMADSRKETAGLAEGLKSMKGELKGIGEIKLGISTKISELALGVLKGLNAGGINSGGIAGWINNLDVSPLSEKISKTIGGIAKDIESQGLWEYLKTKLEELGRFLGKVIADGMKDSFGIGGGGIMGIFGKGMNNKDAIPGVDVKGFLDKINPFSKSGGTKMMEKQLQDQTRILERISDKQGIAIAI